MLRVYKIGTNDMELRVDQDNVIIEVHNPDGYQAAGIVFDLMNKQHVNLLKTIVSDIQQVLSEITGSPRGTEEFWKHVEQAKEEVASWPEWKKNVSIGPNAGKIVSNGDKVSRSKRKSR